MPQKLTRVLLILVALGLAACQAAPATPTSVPVVKLRFTYWGSEMEKAAVEQMVAAFEKANPDIRVEPIQLTYEEYLGRITAMIAQGEGPDVGYFIGLQAPLWAQEGKILEMTDWVQSDPLLSSALPSTRYYFGNGRIAAMNTAVAVTVLFYNKALFDQAGLAYPPADPAHAWTWDQFVEAAKKLTVDVNGRHPSEAGFDPQQIRTYGTAFHKSYEGWTIYPFVFSNGGQLVSDDGTRLLLDSPEASQAIQNLADLMWVHHVTPTPAQDANLPNYVTMLQTGNLAMLIEGAWNLLDLASTRDLKYGVAVLPSLKQPQTVVLGSPTVIFAGTRHKEAALRFYKFHNNPEAVQLFAQGLWMPLQQVYYTDPAKMKFWLGNPAHPAEDQKVFTDYVLNYSTPLPSYYVRNYAEVLDKAVAPAIERIWNNEATAAAALSQATAAAQPLLQGRWDR